MNYLDFELEVGQGAGLEYPISVIRSPAGEARATMLFPFDALELKNRLQSVQIALLRSGGKRTRSTSPELLAVKEFGSRLFDSLLVGEIRSRYDISLQEAARREQGLRLKLRFQTSELANLPWEFMFDSRQDEYVCLSRSSPLIRYLAVPQPILPLNTKLPLQILGMVASPEDQPPLEIDLEKERVETALEPLQRSGMVKLTWLEGQTWRSLQHALQGGPWNVFHYIGHGGFDRFLQEGFIALADEKGMTHPLNAAQLGRLLADHSHMRLVLMNSCEGAQIGDADIFSSSATTLVRRGIPAVIAMQNEISDTAAIEFSRSFYEAMANGMPVDAAVSEARKAISLAMSNSIEWGTPVLYLRAEDGNIFNLDMPASQHSHQPDTALSDPHSQAPPISQIQVGNIGPNSAVAVGPGASVNIQNYQFSGNIAGDVKIAGDVHFTAELPVSPPPMPEQPPEISDFVGREQELSFYKNQLQAVGIAVISGMAGVGKTALAAVIARQTAPIENIFWHTFHPGEGVEAIIWKLAGFLALRGQDDLWQMVQRARQTRANLPPTEILLDYLRELLRGRNLLLCLDDIHVIEHDPKIKLFVEHTRSSVLTSELSLIITSRHQPEFITLVNNAPIHGLTLEATGQLLKQQGLILEPDLVNRLHNSTHGNAELLRLSVELLRNSSHPGRMLEHLAEAEDVERYLISEIDTQLTDIEPDVMGAVSVLNLFGHMGTRYAIAAVLEGQNVRRALRDLADRFLLIVQQRENDRQYGQHSMLQAFYYDALSRRQRQAMHRLAGNYYLAEEPDNLKAAVHFERAGELEKAASLLRGDVWDILNQGQAPVLRDLLERLLQEKGDPLQVAELNLALGKVYAFLGDTPKARQVYEDLFTLLATQPEMEATRVLRLQTFFGLGELLHQEAPHEALALFMEGLGEFESMPRREVAGIHVMVGTIHMWLGNFGEATNFLERGLELLSDEDLQLKATALENLGVVAVENEGDFVKGVSLASRALQASQQLHDHFKTAEILNTLASFKFDSGDWAGAIHNFRESLALAELTGSEKARASCNLNLGIVSIHLGEYEEAQRFLELGLSLAQKTHKLFSQCLALMNLAELNIRRNQWQAAAHYLSESELLAAQLEDKLNPPVILRGWAQVKLATGEIEAALQDAQQAVVLARETGETIELGINLRVLAQVYQADNQIQPALELYRESISLLTGAYPYESARTELRLASALLTSDREQAVSLLNRAKATFEATGALADLAEVGNYLDS